MIKKPILTYTDAKPTDCELLGDLLIEAKAHWGYSTAQLADWRSTINFTNKYLQANHVQLVFYESVVIGFFAIRQADENCLDHLWLKPDFIGRGLGKVIFQELVRYCRALNITTFSVISDPNTEGFYLKMGGCSHWQRL